MCFFWIFICTCKCVGAGSGVGCRSIRYPGARVTGSWNSAGMGAENRTQVSGKAVSHLSRSMGYVSERDTRTPAHSSLYFPGPFKWAGFLYFKLLPQSTTSPQAPKQQGQVTRNWTEAQVKTYFWVDFLRYLVTWVEKWTTWHFISRNTSST